MFFIESPFTSPYANMALEKYLMDQIEFDFCIFYKNQPSVLSGRYQVLNAEINHEYFFHHPVPIVRRLSGGGTVYHDEGNINLCYVGTNADFVHFNKIAGEMTISFLHKLNVPNVHFENVNIFSGKFKISGTASYKKGNRIITHYCLLLDSDLTKLNNYLADNEGYLSKSTKSMRVLTRNLCDIIGLKQESIESTIKDILLSKYCKSGVYRISYDNYERISIGGDQYSSLDWLFFSSPDYVFINSGTIFHEKFKLELRVEHGVVVELKSNLNSLIELRPLFTGVCHSFTLFYNLLNKRFGDMKKFDLFYLTCIFFNSDNKPINS